MVTCKSSKERQNNIGKRITNKVANLLAQKERRDKRRYTYDQLEALTGLGRSTIRTWKLNLVTRFDEEPILAWMQFFGLKEPGELFEVVEGTDESEDLSVGEIKEAIPA